MKIGVLKETDDKRVALTPETLKKHPDVAAHTIIESGAGLNAGFNDDAYTAVAGVVSRDEVLKGAQVVITVNPLADEEMAKLTPGTILISMFEPYNNPDITGQIEKHKLGAFSLDMIPRTTLAQSMDILSSMASISGYKAVLTAANQLPRYFPMMITAAGSIRPAQVLILGAGVAGLQAIATAKRLGAMVEASDVRQAAKEEVMSLGAKFVEVEGAKEDTTAGGYAVEQTKEFLERQKAEVQRRAAKADVIITTAQVRGRKAPILLPKSTVDQMKPGSVIIDLAASSGGNCELTQGNSTYQYNGVTIIGNSDLAEEMPQDASRLFSNNLMNFLKLLIKDGALSIDMDNEIIAGSCIVPLENSSK
ncbi:MAG: NAD(P) transhydrogenase subunit alpha [Saprospiraceae bacterium]|nr:MAG: NAD(P) transhydrogenase subunit alpha [Saprospiraceae bacterium]